MPTTEPDHLLEAVPNISIGRDRARLQLVVSAVEEAITDAATSGRSGRALLADVHVDDDHDRSVLTIVGYGGAFIRALEACVDASVKLVDVGACSGVHPRLGAVDVLPIVPLADDAWGAAHASATRLARRLGERHGVPCVRYGLDERSRAPITAVMSTGHVRRGGAAAVHERIRSGELKLLAGPPTPHPTAGVTIVGVRRVLIAFNVDLAGDDLPLAEKIARRIRMRTGGPQSLAGVRALGMRLERAGHPHVQVSTNVEQPERIGPAEVLDAVVDLAAAAGMDVRRAELVGLAPDAALVPLRRSCVQHGIELAAARYPSLEGAIARVSRSSAPSLD